MKSRNHLLFFLCNFAFLCKEFAMGEGGIKKTVDVGVVLDLGTSVGKINEICISMAIKDFYLKHNYYTTRLNLHIRNSTRDIVSAASIALDLLKNVQVAAFIGPETSTQLEFVVDLAGKAQVPVLSFSASTPSISSSRNPYFFLTAQNDSSQAKPIAAIVEAFGWREVIPIYEDTDYGHGIIPFLFDAFQEISTRIPYKSVVPPSVTDADILSELYKLMVMQTKVFVVHMDSSLGARLFSKAIEAGMMSKGYVWIITTGLTNKLGSMDSSVIESMQGVMGVQPYVPKSSGLDGFVVRLKRELRRERPDIEMSELNVFGLWAYDTVWALAMAVEKVGSKNLGSKKPLETSKDTLREAILATKFKGVSGEFSLLNKQLQQSMFKIINVVGKGEKEIGFWSPTFGIYRRINSNDKNMYSASADDLGTVIWPGDSTEKPKGWAIPTSGKELRIGVPPKVGISQFVRVTHDPITNASIVTGFCRDVFDAVVETLPYSVSPEFFPFQNATGGIAGTYDDLIYQVHLQKYDAVMADTTIRANRSLYVDFTQPYIESGVSMLVPVMDDRKMNAWIFLKPLTKDLWLASGAGFLLTGIVVWILERRINEDFRGTPAQQLGIIFWFSFSTLVFAHKEKVKSNLSRFVLIIWFFVVLILTSSYTASLASMLTVQRLQPTVTDVNQLLKNGYYVGYPKGSFVLGLLRRMNFDESKLRAFTSLSVYADALDKGSSNGGVAAIFDEIPYLNLILANNCAKYTLAGPTYKTGGFGFVFPKGSPLVSDFSTGILNITEGDRMATIERAWLKGDTTCPDQATNVSSNSLTFGSFRGLFFITGTASMSALFIYLMNSLYQQRMTEPMEQTELIESQKIDVGGVELTPDILASPTQLSISNNGGGGIFSPEETPELGSYASPTQETPELSSYASPTQSPYLGNMNQDVMASTEIMENNINFR